METLTKLVTLLLIMSPLSLVLANTDFDEYGKPCTTNPSDSSATHCSLDKNMACSDKGICECIVGERGRIFSHQNKNCIEIGSPENKYACKEDIQCTMSTYGRYSHCNKDFGECQCFDANSETELKGNICYIKNPSLTGRGLRGLQGCQSNGDCQGSSLGNLSRCNQVSNTCECYDTKSGGKLDTTLYEGKCVFPKQLGGYCDDDVECKAGHHQNAVCANHPSYLPQEKICQCPVGGRGCDGSGAISNYKSESKSIFAIGLTTAIMGILATKVFCE